MAQRTIHYLFGELLSKQIELKDKKRFWLGSLIPDAYMDVKFRDVTHYKVRGEEGTYLNFHKFLDVFTGMIAIGSVLFFVSDMMLLLAWFSTIEGRWTSNVCMAAYYPALCLLAGSMVVYLKKNRKG